jgi:hypothetical protein
MSLTTMNTMAPPAPGSNAAATATAEPAASHHGQAGNDPAWLADTDLPKETAQLAALQNRQRLAEASPATLRRAPQTLLSLFGYA